MLLLAADRRHSTVRWRTEEGAVRLNVGTLESASAFENSSTRTKAPLHDTSDKPCRPGALTKNWRRPLRGRVLADGSSTLSSKHLQGGRARTVSFFRCRRAENMDREALASR
jgi:hypothetical protein